MDAPRCRSNRPRSPATGSSDVPDCQQGLGDRTAKPRHQWLQSAPGKRCPDKPAQRLRITPAPPSGRRSRPGESKRLTLRMKSETQRRVARDIPRSCQPAPDLPDCAGLAGPRQTVRVLVRCWSVGCWNRRTCCRPDPAEIGAQKDRGSRETTSAAKQPSFRLQYGQGSVTPMKPNTVAQISPQLDLRGCHGIRLCRSRSWTSILNQFIKIGWNIHRRRGDSTSPEPLR